MVESPSSTPARLVSLDAYRGFIMLLMASSTLAIPAIAAQHFPQSPVWQFLGYEFDHVQWTGCSLWDLIQPAFMFMVGVAMPYSHASRVAKGQSFFRISAHVVYRALILVLLGVFLSSNWSQNTNFSFVNVLTQIGLGYVFVYLLVGRAWTIQLAAALLVLGGYWFLFYQYPAPPPDLNYLATPDTYGWAHGLFAHWSKHTNFATACDQWLLPFFHYSDSNPFNRGGYQTLNFVPSMGTMIFGLMTGHMLRGPKSPGQKLATLLWTGALCLGVGLALGYTVCPIVKRIWTPSWTIFSTGWTLWMLAAFYALIDVAGWKRWALPLVVVGVNSIAMYCMSQLLRGWVRQTLKTHLDYAWQRLLAVIPNESTRDTLQVNLGQKLFEGIYGPMVLQIAILLVFWLICLWLYRRKVFLRI